MVMADISGTNQRFKYRLVSDVHLEFARDPMKIIHGLLRPLDTDSDTYLFVCGDLYPHKTRDETGFIALEEWSKRFKYVIYVCGNHEYYGGVIEDINERIKYEVKHLKNVIFLNNNSFTIDDVSIFGSTFWSPLTSHPVDSYTIKKLLNDFLMIRHRIEDEDGIEQYKQLLLPARYTEMFYEAVVHYYEWISQSKARINIVLSHHGPSELSTLPQFRFAEDRETQLLNQCYYFDAKNILPMFDKVDLFCHGHVHNSVDYKIGNTRVLTNPYGYVGHALNYKFNNTILEEI